MSPARHRENHRALQRQKAILYKQTDKEIKVRNQHQTQNRFAAPTAITRSSKAQNVANPKREAHTKQRWKKKRIQIKKPAKAMIKRQEVLPENRNITSLINNDTNLYIVHYPRAFIIIIVVRIVYVGEWLVLCAHLMVRHVCSFPFLSPFECTWNTHIQWVWRRGRVSNSQCFCDVFQKKKNVQSARFSVCEWANFM